MYTTVDKIVRKLFTQIEEHWNHRNPRINFQYLNTYEECAPFKKTEKHVIMSETEISKRIGRSFYGGLRGKKDIKLLNSWGLSKPEKVYVREYYIGYKCTILSEQKLMLHMLTH